MDEKEMKTVVEKADFLYDELKSAMEIVYNFIKENNLILYGGMALDLALKERGHEGIYSDDALPDFDFFSANSYDNSNQLAMILYEKGYKHVTAINAMHATTRRTRVFFKEVADISYMPPVIFDKIDTLAILHGKYKGIRIIDPLYIRMDMLRFFIYPFENPPREPILSRTMKIIKRFKILDEFYPIEVNKYQAPKLVKIKLPTKDGILTGLQAYDLYLRKAQFVSKAHEQMFNHYKLSETELEAPEFMRPAIFGPFFQDEALVKKSEIYNMFLETLQPQTLLCDNVEYYDTMKKQIIYTIIDDKKVITIFGLMLYFLRKAVLFEKGSDNRMMCYHAYNSLVQMVDDAEAAFAESTEKNYDKIPFFYQINVFGETEQQYIEPLIKTRDELEGKPFVSILPKFTFAPGRHEPGTPLPTFDYASSIKFAIDGARRLAPKID